MNAIAAAQTTVHRGMPRYWLGVVSREHVLRGVEVGIVQVNHGKRTPLERLSPGDGFL